MIQEKKHNTIPILKIGVSDIDSLGESNLIEPLKSTGIMTHTIENFHPLMHKPIRLLII